MYICQLSEEQQSYIKRAISRKLYQLGYKGAEHKEILQNGMDSKLCDVSDTIDLMGYYRKFEVKKIDWNISIFFLFNGWQIYLSNAIISYSR